MTSYDISVGRIHAGCCSITDFIMLVSDIETALLTLRALERCDIADDVDIDGFLFRTNELVWIAEQLGQACGLNLIPDYLFQKYVIELILLGQTVDDSAWNYGFRKGTDAVQDVD